MAGLLKRALEERTDGKSENEIEIEVYGKLVDVGQLFKAMSKEHQTQYQIRVFRDDKFNAADCVIRERMVIPNIVDFHHTQYVNTRKTFDDVVDGNNSVSVVSSEDGFKQMSRLARDAMIKDRYSFPISGTDLVWEVDCFYMPGAEIGSANYHPWVKIDLEVDNLGQVNELPPLPIELTDVLVVKDKAELTPEQKSFIEQLYNDYFRTKNPNV